MTKLELLTVMHSLNELHELKQHEAAHRVIKKIIAEAKSEQKAYEEPAKS